MTITFGEEHNDPQNSQLLICITGTPEGIEKALKNLQKGTNNWPDNYKPIQGRTWVGDAEISVITPIWEGEKYS